MFSFPRIFLSTLKIVAQKIEVSIQMDIEIETFLGLGANQRYIIKPIKQKIALQLHRKKL